MITIDSQKLLNINIDQNINLFWIYDRFNKLVYLNIQGPLGILRLNIPKISIITFSNKLIYLTYTNKKSYSLTKTIYKLILSNLKGINTFYQINLNLSGIGYKVQSKNSTLYFDLGYSHKIKVNLPECIKIDIKNQGTSLILKSINKIELGKIAFRLMKLKPNDSYKGKGIINTLKPIQLKLGKKKNTP